MNIGNLPPEAEDFVRQYKRLGYATRTQLITDAINALRLQKACETRARTRDEWLARYAASQPENIWRPLDDEDFA
jgi:hypothetical protein